MDLTGLGSAFSFAKGIMDRFWPKQASEAEKLEAVKELAPMIERRDNAVVEAKRDIIVSEMKQDDNYTKRARPSVVYMGLVFIGLVHVVFPLVTKVIMLIMYAGMDVEVIKVLEASPKALEELKGLSQIELPGAFWAAWGSVVSIWEIGRSVEKKGVVNKVVSMVTGTKNPVS